MPRQPSEKNNGKEAIPVPKDKLIYVKSIFAISKYFAKVRRLNHFGLALDPVTLSYRFMFSRA